MWRYGGIALLAFWFALPAAGAQPVRLVTGDNFSPYAGQVLPHGGMLTEVVQRAFAAAGKDTALSWMAWKRGYALTKLGEFDATFPYARSHEREQDYLYSALLYGDMRSVFARPGSDIDPGSPASFRGRTYCLPVGFLVYPQIGALQKEKALRVERPGSLADCARMLALGRVDFYIADRLSGDASLREAGVGGRVVRLAKPFEQAAFYLLVPKSRPGAVDLIAGFNAGLKRLRESGEYERIVRRHLGS